MRLNVHYAANYQYSAAIIDSHNEARLMPVSDEHQTCLEFRLTPEPSAIVFSYDLPFGRVHHFNIRRPHQELRLVAEAVVQTHRRLPGMLFSGLDWGFYGGEVESDHAEYLLERPRTPHLTAAQTLTEAARRESDGAGPDAFVRTVMHTIYREYRYLPGATRVDTPLDEFLTQGAGVCQDFAHLMLAVCRSARIPARYVSGYLFAGRRDDPALSGGGATHAWVECLLPDGQWYGYDPTNALLANDSHIKMHHGRDYDDAPPLRGVFKGVSKTEVDVAVHVIDAD